jgi:hypothetical protein
VLVGATSYRRRSKSSFRSSCRGSLHWQQILPGSTLSSRHCWRRRQHSSFLLPDAMASNLPIPRPPRTPTPPPDDPKSVTDSQPQRGLAVSYDKDTLSPMVDNFSQNESNEEDRDRLSPTRSSFKLSPTDGAVQSGASDNGSAGPFNFQTTSMAKGPVMKSVSACFYCVLITHSPYIGTLIVVRETL